MNENNNRLNLKATPEDEDFRGKYESGKIANRLLDGYFLAVRGLTEIARIKHKKAAAIEIGCGEGLPTKRINSFLPENITMEASEYVDHQINFAKKNNPNTKITQESIYELKHADNSFDLIYLLEVLEHLDYPDKALTELKRVLKDDGYLILGVPREPIWRVLNVARGKYWDDLGNTPGHLNHWSTNSLIDFVETNFGPVIAKRNPLPWTLVLAKKHEK